MKKSEDGCDHKFDKWSAPQNDVVRGEFYSTARFKRVYQERVCEKCNLLERNVVDMFRIEDAKPEQE